MDQMLDHCPIFAIGLGPDGLHAYLSAFNLFT
jgi:hypothetical protein